MRWATIAILAGLLALPALPAGTAATDTGVSQTHLVLSAGELEAPDDPDGLYTTNVTIEAAHSGGIGCACTQTSVSLYALEAEPITDVRFRPASFTIDWTERPTPDQSSGEIRTIPVSFRLAEDKRGEDFGAFRVTLTGEATSDLPTSEASVLPTQVTVTPPGQDGSSSRSQASSTSSTGPVGSGAAPGGFVAAGLAVLALASLARRLR